MKYALTFLVVLLLLGCKEDRTTEVQAQRQTLHDQVSKAVPLEKTPLAADERDRVLANCAKQFPPESEREKFDYCIQRIPFDNSLPIDPDQDQ
uniref:hypothetical protein n=1 Tax=Parerythrobacter lutipelagi TaxID=1964208 RepID=UPI0010F6B895|nr:hypothetical protein [Parerythrobacter lutipelagi]